MAPERVCALHPNPLPGGERELPVRFTGAALLFRFSTEPFFVDFVVSSVLAQGFQRAVDFVTQLRRYLSGTQYRIAVLPESHLPL